MNLRVGSEVKRQVVEYAQKAGLSINAAAIVLLIEGLRAERGKR